MNTYVVPRSVQRLEEEVAELEKQYYQTEDTDEQEEEQSLEQNTEQPKNELQPLDKEEETWKKRHGDLRRLSQKQAEELKRANERIAAIEREKQSAGLPSENEVEEWAKANPKAYAIIRGLAIKETSNTSEEVLSIRQELEKTKQEVKIKKVHPDFEEITSSDEFHTWAENQTQSVQNLIFDNDNSDDIIWALSLYKKETGTKENPDKSAARNVVNKSSNAPTDLSGKKKFSESQVQKMSVSEYEKNEEAIKEAMSNGSFVYDLSGAAR